MNLLFIKYTNKHVRVSCCALLASLEPVADALIVQPLHGWDCLLNFCREFLGGFSGVTRAHWIFVNPELLQFDQCFAEVRDGGLVTDLVVVQPQCFKLSQIIQCADQDLISNMVTA